ncbi:MAG: ketopantoate reductase family protein [Bacillota bacterium]
MRLAVLGAGSLGTIIGALITKGGHDTILIDSNIDHVRALNENGATIQGKMNLNVPVKACTPNEIEGKFDAVIYLAKAPSNSEALTSILPHLTEESVVCTLQNGIPEEAVAGYVGKDRTVGGAVGFGASWKGPGVSALTSDPSKMMFDIGELDGSITPRIQKIKNVLDLSGSCNITNNLIGYRWTKLILNAAFSGMSAALGCNYGEVLDNKNAMLCAAFIVDECVKVAHAEGVSIEVIQGADFNKATLEKGKSSIEEKMPFYNKLLSPHRQIIASMLFDLRLGKKTEIDTINGEVSLRGRRSGVPTPFNDRVVEVVKREESRESVPTINNLNLFSDIIARAD